MNDLVKRKDVLALFDLIAGGEEYIADRERLIAALPAIDPAAIRISRNGEHLFNTAKSLGWKDDGEGALEFIMRRTREVAFEDTAADHIEELVSELDLMENAGIIEIASRNNRVTEYMFHWEGRALDAEAKLAKAMGALREIEGDCDTYYPPSHGAIKYTIRDVLAELEGK